MDRLDPRRDGAVVDLPPHDHWTWSRRDLSTHTYRAPGWTRDRPECLRNEAAPFHPGAVSREPRTETRGDPTESAHDRHRHALAKVRRDNPSPGGRPLRIDGRHRNVYRGHRCSDRAHLLFELDAAVPEQVAERVPERGCVRDVSVGGLVEPRSELERLANALVNGSDQARVGVEKVLYDARAERDMSRFITRNCGEACPEARQEVVGARPLQDELLPGQGENALNHEVVHGYRLREQRGVVGPVAQLRRKVLQIIVEERPEPGPDPPARRADATRDVAVSRRDDLLEPAVEEDRMTRLVRALGREKDPLVGGGRSRQVRRESGGDPLLGDVEGRQGPQKPLLVIGVQAQPVLPVAGEIEIGDAPVEALPPQVQLAVGGHALGNRGVQALQDGVGIEVRKLAKVTRVLSDRHRLPPPERGQRSSGGPYKQTVSLSDRRGRACLCPPSGRSTWPPTWAPARTRGSRGG